MLTVISLLNTCKSFTFHLFLEGLSQGETVAVVIFSLLVIGIILVSIIIIAVYQYRRKCESIVSIQHFYRTVKLKKVGSLGNRPTHRHIKIHISSVHVYVSQYRTVPPNYNISEFPCDCAKLR